MSFRTIVTKRDGECKRCGQVVPAGTSVRYNGRGIWHLAAACPVKKENTTTPETVLSAAQMLAEIERLRAALHSEAVSE